MYFYKNLYAGPSIRDPEEVKRKLMRGEGQFTIYVIALSPSRFPGRVPTSLRFSTASISNSRITKNIPLS